MAQFVAGAVLVAGLAAVWWVLTHHPAPVADPQEEIDRRIDDLDNSLTQLQNVFGNAAGG